MQIFKHLIRIFVLFVFSLLFTINVEASRTYRRGIVTAKGAVTKEASASSAMVKNDEGINIYLSSPEAVEIIDETGSYYKIRFLYSGFKYEGYIPTSKVEAISYTTDDNYEASLQQAGFPADYAAKLAVLHAIHPNWTFTPSFTGHTSGGMDFAQAVSEEADVIARNLISGSNTSLRSTRDGAYQNGVWISLSGSGWYAASEQTIAYYLDPRNFLDESHVFMFENLGYNPTTQTRDTVNKVLTGTFMANPFECFSGANSCAVGTHYFVDSFVSAGVDKAVSPVHLASRVKQEQGVNGSVLSLGKGYNNNYVGYYNFFNIGASGTTDAEVITNGLAYAYNKGWNNQHISIYDGSTTIASNYISVGQSTIYYQKFNTINKNYSHQYQQNVEAPYSESYSTYTSYYNSYSNRSDWDNGVYDFLIPIYQNMGSATSLDASGNADATLKSLSISSCVMNPEFQSSAYTYDCYTAKSTTELTISAEATNYNATVQNPGTISLNSDEATVSVVVTAAAGNTSTYTIYVHRIETDGYTPSQILNGIGLKTNANYLYNAAAGSDVSNIISSIKNTYHFATVKVQEADGTVITSGVVKAGQKITVTNTGITGTYGVIIYGDPTGDGTIDIRDLLAVQKYLVGSKTVSGEYWFAMDINKDATIDIRDLLLVQKHLVGAYSISQG